MSKHHRGTAFSRMFTTTTLSVQKEITLKQKTKDLELGVSHCAHIVQNLVKM